MLCPLLLLLHCLPVVFADCSWRFVSSSQLNKCLSMRDHEFSLPCSHLLPHMLTHNRCCSTSCSLSHSPNPKPSLTSLPCSHLLPHILTDRPLFFFSFFFFLFFYLLLVLLLGSSPFHHYMVHSSAIPHPHSTTRLLQRVLHTSSSFLIDNSLPDFIVLQLALFLPKQF